MIAAEGVSQIPGIEQVDHRGSPASPRTFARPSTAPSDAASRTPALPCFKASRTFSNPATAIPARRARPNRLQTATLQQRLHQIGQVPVHPDKRRAALPKALFLNALFRVFRSAVTQSPRPGRVPSRSGTTKPSGDTTKRIMPERSATVPVTMQRLIGLRRPPIASSSSSSGPVVPDSGLAKGEWLRRGRYMGVQRYHPLLGRSLVGG